MIVILWKILTLTRDTHTEQLGLGRRHLHILEGIIGILGFFKHLQFIYTFKFLQYIDLQILTYKLRH